MPETQQDHLEKVYRAELARARNQRELNDALISITEAREENAINEWLLETLRGVHRTLSAEFAKKAEEEKAAEEQTRVA